MIYPDPEFGMYVAAIGAAIMGAGLLIGLLVVFAACVVWGVA